MKGIIKEIFSDNDRKEIIAKGISFLSIRTGGLLFGYLFAYLVTTNFGASAYGLIVLCFSIFLFFGILGRLGLDINLVRYYSNPSNLQNAGLFYRTVTKAFVISLLLSIALFFSRDLLIYDLFNKPELEPYYIWMVIPIPFWAISLICGGVLRAQKHNNWFAFLNQPGRLFFTVLIFAIFLLSSHYDPEMALMAHCFAIIILAVVAVIRCLLIFKKFSWTSPVDDWNFIKSSAPMMLSSTALVLLGWMDTFALGIYAPEDQIGIYAIALKIATLGGFIFLATSSILAPKLALLFSDGQEEEFNRLVRFTTRINFISAFLIILFILLFRTFILGLFGMEFIAGSEVLIILCAGQLIMAFSGAVGVIMQMTGKQLQYQNIVAIALLLNIALNFSLVPSYGIYGAAVATAVSMAFWNIAAAIYIKKTLGVRSYFSPLSTKRAPKGEED